MNKQSTSGFIFDLIDEYDIFDVSGNCNPLTDDAFHSFCLKYQEESLIRDKHLFEHITLHPNNFRCHLPHSKWSLGFAFNVFWYYDELILSDPILNQIRNPTNNAEWNKRQLQELLLFIIEFKDCISGGYVLFAGDNLIPNRTSKFQAESDKLLKDKEVLNSFENSTIMGQRPSRINSNESDNLQQLMIYYEGMWGKSSSHGMYIPEHLTDSGKLSNGITLDFSTSYKPLSKEELLKFGKYDMLDGLKGEYSKDVSVVLESLANGQHLKTPVLFFRELDSVVAHRFPASKDKLVTDTSVYNCAIPYLDGIPTNKLFEAREQMPEAFRDFRSFLYELVNETMKKTANPNEIKFIIDSKILPLQRSLEVEMKNAQRKWKFQGLAAPILLGMGSLGLYSSSMDYSNIISTILGSGGAMSSLKTWGDVKSKKQKVELEPVYFLWKAQELQR